MIPTKDAVKARHVPKSKRPLHSPVNTESTSYQKNAEEIFQKADEMRAAADTLLRFSLARG